MTLNASSTRSSSANAVWPLFIVILNWNLPDETLACLDSVRAAVEPIPQVQIVIVDNGSSDDSTARLGRAVESSHDVPATLLETGRNLGFAGGMNAGIRYALAQGAASVLLLNNDTLVDPAMVSYLAAALAGDPAAGLAGPAIYYHAAPARLWRFGDNEQTWLPIPRRIPHAVAAAGDGTPVAVDYITACAMLVRRAVFERIGFLDESFFFYFEDADFCRRARDAGFGIRGVPRAKMWHKVSLSAQRARATTYYSGTWARVQFYRRHPHGELPWLVHPYLWGRALIASVGHLARGEWALLGPLWRGMVDGYTDSITAEGAKDAKKREEGKKRG